MKQHQVTKIVTPCPHCFNILSNEYVQFGGKYEVLHHAQLLSRLIDQGRLGPPGDAGATMTLHDPCYLARANGETDAQRKVLGVDTNARQSSFRELPQHGANTFCCGAGGGRMWFDEPPQQRVSNVRAQQVADSGAEILATACPFCLNMMSDALAGDEGRPPVKVLDIAEVLVNGRHKEPSA